MQVATPLRTGAAVAVAAAVCVALAAPATARAGAYRAAVCNPSLGATHGAAAFARSSPRFEPRAACGAGGGGLTVTHDPGSTRPGAWGAWTIRAPRGTLIKRLGVTVEGRRGGGIAPELDARSAGGSRVRFAAPGSRTRRFAWSGAPAKAVSGRLRCRLAAGCPHGSRAAIHIRRASLVLDDRVAPVLGASGSLLGPGSTRGRQTLDLSGSDVGGGVRRLLLGVNGQPVAAHTVACRLAGPTATRLRPCPSVATASFAVATARPPFHQGPNRVVACAADLAETTAANRTCVTRRVRVDNLCPISSVAGARLRARLVGGGRRLATRRGRGATVAGRLSSPTGEPVSGASVCVASRIRTPSALEQVVATPTTRGDGRFRVRLPSGPSRQIRVAHWASSSAAIERFLDLRVRPRPRLAISPGHPIHNGDRVRLRVLLPQPSPSGRRVKVQVRAGGRWLNLRAGRTGSSGVYRCRYRFHATTGRRTYRFRAAVPKQRGYPYQAGKSATERVTVVG